MRDEPQVTRDESRESSRREGRHPAVRLGMLAALGTLAVMWRKRRRREAASEQLGTLHPRRIVIEDDELGVSHALQVAKAALQDGTRVEFHGQSVDEPASLRGAALPPVPETAAAGMSAAAGGSASGRPALGAGGRSPAASSAEETSPAASSSKGSSPAASSTGGPSSAAGVAASALSTKPWVVNGSGGPKGSNEGASAAVDSQHRRAPAKGRGVFAIAKEAVMAWIADNGLQQGAAIAYYTIFAIAPLMLIMVTIAGLVFGDDAAQGQVFGQIEGLVGADAARAIQEMLASTQQEEGQGVFGTIVSIVTALIGASAVFIGLKTAFDSIYKPAETHDTKEAVTAFVRARLVSIAIVLSLGFLIVVSLILSAAVAGLAAWLGRMIPFIEPVMSIFDVLLSTGVLTVAFWVLIRYLPDRPPAPRAVWIGAFTSAVLFAIGKHLIGLYLARGAVASAYGAAGSLIVIVVWVYYSTQILLIGAEVARSIDDPQAASDKAAEGRQSVATAGGR